MDLDSITLHQYIEKHRLLQPQDTYKEHSDSPVSTSPFKEKHTGPKEMFTRRESVKESSIERVHAHTYTHTELTGSAYDSTPCQMQPAAALSL